MKSRQRNASATRIVDFNPAEATFGSDALQIHRQERGPMGRVACLLERREATYDCERQHTRGAHLIRCRHDQTPAWCKNPDELPVERPRIVEMLDDLDGRNDRSATIRQRDALGVEIRLEERQVISKAAMTHHVDA